MTTQTITEPSVSLEAWGNAVLEELLIQGALHIPPKGLATGPVEVTLRFQLSADQEGGRIEARLLRNEGTPVLMGVGVAD